MIDRLLRETTLVTISLGIAVGYSLIHLAQAVGETVTLLFGRSAPAGVATEGTLQWRIGDRLLELGPVIAAGIQLGLVLLVAATVLAARGRGRRSA